MQKVNRMHEGTCVGDVQEKRKGKRKKKKLEKKKEINSQ